MGIGAFGLPCGTLTARLVSPVFVALHAMYMRQDIPGEEYCQGYCFLCESLDEKCVEGVGGLLDSRVRGNDAGGGDIGSVSIAD